jgi:hypothetical protein
MIVFTDSTGQLLGAQNLDVSRTSYEVEFSDDRCFALFTDDYDNSYFIFSDLASVTLATEVSETWYS